MGPIRLAMLLGMAGMFFLIGCAETSSGRGVKSRIFSGALLETKTSEGRERRVRVTDLEPWQRWHRNPIKGDGDNLIVKAELTF
ncbi:MAG: hypothetical protein QME75_00950 [Deltaproteobacteria bacterium]|nr:hypothetical protein [Deltaproteobacteria bacterium]